MYRITFLINIIIEHKQQSISKVKGVRRYSNDYFFLLNDKIYTNRSIAVFTKEKMN